MGLLYIQRWLKVPFEKPNGEIQIRKTSVPQGGVISPVLSNLFLHYVYDKWMQMNFGDNPWCKYADDRIIHCMTKNQAEYIRRRIEARFTECRFEIHLENTRIVCCKDSNRIETHENIEFTFLSYTFMPRRANGKNGEEFTSFLPAISNKAKLIFVKQ